jgi:hypothetical protein
MINKKFSKNLPERRRLGPPRRVMGLVGAVGVGPLSGP